MIYPTLTSAELSADCGFFPPTQTIRNWLHYRSRRAHLRHPEVLQIVRTICGVDSKGNLLSKTGKHGKLPRALTAAQLWSRENYESIKDDVERHCRDSNISGRQKAGAKSSFVKIHFDGLPEDERESFVQRAEELKERLQEERHELANRPVEMLPPKEAQK